MLIDQKIFLKRIAVRNALIIFFVTFTVIVFSAEVLIRLAGGADFPLYIVNNRIGYIPAPNQQGDFFKRNPWVTNERSMGTHHPFQDTIGGIDVLLIGDDIVWGGHSYYKHDRLASQIETGLDDLQISKPISIWPISSGNWGLANQLNWLSDNPDVVEVVEQVHFVLSNDDFDTPASWSNPFSHPIEKPVSALYFLAQKHLFSFDRPQQDPNLIVPEFDIFTGLKVFVETCSCDVIVWLYPEATELVRYPLEAEIEYFFLDKLSAKIVGKIDIIRVRDFKNWDQTLYRDTVNPTAEGLRVFGNNIADHIVKKSKIDLSERGPRCSATASGE